MPMSREEARSILRMEEEEAIDRIQELSEKAEKYDQLFTPPDPEGPSGMTPTYKKPNHRGKKKKPGQKKGHTGVGRKKPTNIDKHKEHTLKNCPHCHTPTKKNSVRVYTRLIEDIEPVRTNVTEHSVHGYWCPKCKKVVRPAVKDALPGSMIGLRLVVFTAWLHYVVGVSVNNLVNVLTVFSHFRISPGGLTQAWLRLAAILEPDYDTLGREAANSAVLHADETGWRLNGVTHWLWAFANKHLCYYLISPSRGSPVIEQVLGKLFQGILITDFWAAYNKVVALAKQKCFFHLFTELVKVDKKNNSLAWHLFRNRLSRLLKDALRLSGKRGELSEEKYQHSKQRLYTRLDDLAATKAIDDDVQRLRKRLERHRNEMLTFLEYENVSPYNNFAEQQMRPPVITRKISHQNRSNEAARAQAILMSLFQTAKLREENPVESVLALAQKAVELKNVNKGLYKKAA